MRIVDPSGGLLSRWCERASGVAMTWMRSPILHHLGDKPTNLNHFARLPENADVSSVSGVFKLPTHAAFLRHSRAVIEEHGLEELVVRGRVEALRRDGEQLEVRGPGVELRARRVLIATGSNRLRLPDWSRPLRESGAPIHHVFERDAPLHHDFIGGGVSAIQRALLVHRETREPVRLWMRRPVSEAEFDYDRDWSKHRFVAEWSNMTETERFHFLRRNPTQGSVTPVLTERLARAIRKGALRVETRIPRVEWLPAEERLRLSVDGDSFESPGITLVTGFEDERVDGWLAETAAALGLPVIEGLPRLDSDMHWGAGVHVTGPLALLRLGPMARNIVGARWATSSLPGVRMQPV